MTGLFVARMGMGLLKPKNTRLGVDFAGVVEAVGGNVKQFRPGDEVFGGKNGAFAEYVCVREDRGVALKPANVTFEQAAAVPTAALTALQGLRDHGQLQPGQRLYGPLARCPRCMPPGRTPCASHWSAAVLAARARRLRHWPSAVTLSCGPWPMRFPIAWRAAFAR